MNTQVSPEHRERPQASVHLVNGWNGDAALTKCGLTGWPDRGRGVGEFDTSAGGRFEAVHDLRKVTCRRCSPHAGRGHRPGTPAEASSRAARATTGEATYRLDLTYAQLWQLRESYEAAFTAPDDRTGVEIEVANILSEVHAKAWKARQSPKKA